MKKLAAILLMCLMLFHWMGYQALYGLWMQQANREMDSRLDKSEYDEQELITIAIPLHLPYLTDQAEFERQSGETIFNGITYQYLQRRVYHDSLYLQCLPNHEAMRLKTARNDYFKFTSDIQQSGSGISKPGVTFIKHFTGENGLFAIQHPVTLLTGNQVFYPAIQVIPHQLVTAGPDHPPEAII